MAKYELLPQKKKTEAKIETTTVINEAEDEEEDQSYDLNEVTSQFIGDESTYSAVDLCGGKKRNHDKRTRHKLLPCGSDVVECSENCSGSLKKAGTETEANKYIDVKDAEAKNKKNTKRSHLLHGEEKWKRRKNQMKLNPTKNEPPISGDSQVNQILVDCGIHHTHSNKLIIGPSKAENEMTSRAIKEVFDLGQGSQQPANCFAAIESDGEESDDISDYNQQGTATSGDTNRDSEKSDDKMAVSTGRDQKEMMVRKIGDTSVLFGETPKTIRLRQFSEIAQTRGYESEVDLAKAVVSSSVKERMNMLKDFYKTRDYDCNILSYFESVQASVETEDHTSGTKNKKLPRCDRTFTVFKPRHHRKKSYTKILQATLNKKNVLNKNSSKEGKNSLSSSGAQDRTCVLTKARSVDVANACFSVKRRAEYSETTGSSLLANEDVGSRNGFDIKCTDDNTGKPQTSDLRNNICLSSLADLPAVTSAIPAGPEHSQSSFLDEFLFECSQQNKISSERSRIDDNENVPDSARRASGKKFSSSVIDDLI